MNTQKWVPWPGNGQVNIQPIAPIIHDHHFRRMSDKKQLAFGYLVFPGATHDRRQHCMGAYVKASEFTGRMVARDLMNPAEAHNISLFALLHDVGHGPFSHVIEVLTKMDHEEYGVKILGRMARQIEQCGGDVELIQSYMSGWNPAGKIVMDKNFGMDKLDYLVRDQEATEFGPNIRECVESVFNHLVYRDGELMVDLKVLDAAIEIQRAYIYFYRNVHLEKSVYLIQRFMQKLIFQLLHTPKARGGISEDELWEMVDGDLIYALKRCENETVKNGISIFNNGVKHFPKTGLAIRLHGYEWLERQNGKPIHVMGLDKEFFDKFFAKSGASDLELVEREVAELLGVESWKVAISHIVEKGRFIPKDISLYDGPTVYSLRQQDSNYFSLLESELDKYLCVRVCVVPEHRRSLYENWQAVLKILCDYVGYGVPALV